MNFDIAVSFIVVPIYEVALTYTTERGVASNSMKNIVSRMCNSVNGLAFHAKLSSFCGRYDVFSFGYAGCLTLYYTPLYNTVVEAQSRNYLS